MESLSFPVDICLLQFDFKMERVQQRERITKDAILDCSVGKVSLEESTFPNSLSESDRDGVWVSSASWASALITRIMRAGIPSADVLFESSSKKNGKLCLENAEASIFDIANTFLVFFFFAYFSSVRVVLSI